MKILSKVIFIVLYILLIPYSNAYAYTMGFILDGDTFISFACPGAIETMPYSINDSGQIVGRCRFPNDSRIHSFLKDGDTYLYFDYPGAIDTYAYSINDAGQIVGHYFDGSGGYSYLRDGDTSFTSFFPAGGLDINDAGIIVGSDTNTSLGAFMFDGITYTPIVYPGALRTWVYGINDSGNIIGKYTLPGNEYIYYYFLKEGDTFTAFGCDLVPVAINDVGQMLVRPEAVNEQGFHNYYVKDGDIYTALSYNFPYIQTNYIYPEDINDSGQIVGWYSDIRESNSVPEAGIIELLGIGIIALAGVKKKFH